MRMQVGKTWTDEMGWVGQTIGLSPGRPPWQHSEAMERPRFMLNCSKMPCGWVGGTGKNWSPNPPSWHICRVPYGGLGTPVKTIPQPTLAAHPKSLNCCNSKAEVGVGSLAEEASSGCSILLPSFRTLEIYIVLYVPDTNQ